MRVHNWFEHLRWKEIYNWWTEIRKYSGICFFSPISMYGASFPLDFSRWNWFCTQNIKFPHFSGIFPLSLGHRTWFWTQNFKFPVFLDFFLEIFWKSRKSIKNDLSDGNGMGMMPHMLKFEKTPNLKEFSDFQIISGKIPEKVWKSGCIIEVCDLYGTRKGPSGPC